MELRNCDEKYWEFVRLLRSDSRVSGGFIERVFVTEEMQKKYMKVHAHEYRIAVIDEQPVGYIGVVDNDIRICTHPDHQNRGVGKFLLTEALKIWPNAAAKIKTDNEYSIKLFKSCGFKIKYYLLERE